MSPPRPALARKRLPKPLLARLGDERLIGHVRAGDPAAFEVLYARHVPGVLSFCRHMLGTREEAEDAVQVVFASVHRAIHRDRRAISFKAWLFTIARRQCLTVLRARRASAALEVEPSTAGLTEEVERREDLRLLLVDLADLPDAQRAALVLTELDDLSHHEVAQVLECEAWQVKGLVFRARTGLIERRDARSTCCEEIREELTEARGGAMKRGRLRHHLRACPACAAFLADLRAHRRRMSALLPVLPTAALHQGVLGTGAAVTAAAPASAVSAAAWLGGGTIAKVAAAGTLAAGTATGAGALSRDAGIDRATADAPRIQVQNGVERRSTPSESPLPGDLGSARSLQALDQPSRPRHPSDAGGSSVVRPPARSRPEAAPVASGPAPPRDRESVAMPAVAPHAPSRLPSVPDVAAVSATVDGVTVPRAHRPKDVGQDAGEHAESLGSTAAPVEPNPAIDQRVPPGPNGIPGVGVASSSGGQAATDLRAPTTLTPEAADVQHPDR